MVTTGLSYWAMTLETLSGLIIFVALTRIPPGLLKHSQSLVRAEMADSIKALSYFNAASVTGFAGLTKKKETILFDFILVFFSVGPPLTGMLMDHFQDGKIGYAIAGKIAATLFLINALLVYFAVPNLPTLKKAPANNFETIDNDGKKKKKGLFDKIYDHGLMGALSSCRRLVEAPFCYIYIAKFLNSQATFMSRSAYLPYLETELKLTSSELGWISSVGPLVTVACTPLVAPLCAFFKGQAPRLQALCCLLEVSSVFTLLAAPNWFVVLLACFPHGLSSAVGRVNYTAMSLEFGKGTDIGSLIGLDQSVLAFSRMIAPAVAGVLMDISVTFPLYLEIGLLFLTSIVFDSLTQLLKAKSD